MIARQLIPGLLALVGALAPGACAATEVALPAPSSNASVKINLQAPAQQEQPQRPPGQILERKELPGGLIREKLRLPGFDPDESVPAIAMHPVSGGPFPVTICLHSFRGAKENLEGWCRELASRGIFAISIDAGYGSRLRELVASIDPRTRFGQIPPKALCLINGARDEYIDIESVRRFVAELEPLYGKDRSRLRFLPFHDAGHGVSEAMWKEAREWIVQGLEKRAVAVKSR